MKTTLQLRLKQALTGLLGVCAVLAVQAQTPAVAPATPYPGTQAGASDVGNYVTMRTNTGTNMNISVSVWGGPNGGFGWQDDAMGSTGVLPFSLGPVSDPDVALSIDGKCATVVYRYSGNIYKEHFAFAGPNFINISGPAMVSTGGTCYNPNIDAGKSNKAAITWQEGSSGNYKVLTRGVDVCGGTMGPVISLSNAAGFGGNNCYSPDVAVYDGPGGTAYEYTYVVGFTGGSALVHHIEKAVDVWAGAPVVPFMNVPHVVSMPQSINQPRIAAQAWTGTTEPDAVSVVFIEHDGAANTYAVMGYNNVTGIQNISNIMGVNNCGNKAPAITWTQCNEYVVSWVHDNSFGPCGTSPIGSNVLSRRLDAVGTPFGPYQWVENPVSGTAAQSALSGRFATNPEIMTSFVNWSAGNVFYKFTPCGGSPYMRESSAEQMESGLAIYPNPASDQVNITGIELKEVMIYNISGQLVRQIDADNNNTININVSDLPQGMYIFEVNSADGVRQERISIQ